MNSKSNEVQIKNKASEIDHSPISQIKVAIKRLLIK